MNDNQFEQKMKQLKQNYNQLPTKSSSASIMAQIKKEKKRKWFTANLPKQLQIAAMIAVTIGIGYVLGMSQMFNQDQTLESEPPVEQPLPEHHGSDPENNQMTEIPINEEPDESVTKVSRPEEQTINIINEEGGEEEKQVKLLTDAELPFSTYYDARFKLETITNDKESIINIYADYGNGQIEPSIFGVSQYVNSMPAEEQLETYVNSMINSGYEEIEHNDFMGQIGFGAEIIEEFAFQQNSIDVHIAAVEFGENVYFLRASKISDDNIEMIELNEGFSRELKIIAEQMEWIY